MPTPTYIALANITLTGNDTTVEFGSIPNTYRDLVLVLSGRSDRSGQSSDIYKILVNNSATGYSRVVAYGTGSTASSYADASLNEIRPFALTAATSPANTFGLLTINIMDYATDKHKTFLLRENLSATELSMSSYRWANTNAISSIQISPLFGTNLVSGSTFALYGIIS